MKKLSPTDDSATRPISLPAMAERADHLTVAAPRICVEHGWVTASRHQTSLGTLIYSTCVACGTHRVEKLASDALFPETISREVRSESGRTGLLSPHPPLG